MPAKPAPSRRRNRFEPRNLGRRTRREGTFAWYHPPAARDRHAFPRVRLADDYVEACREAEARNQELDRWRRGLAPAATAGAAPAGTLAALIATYHRSRAWQSLAARTQRDYERVFAALGDDLNRTP
jgi:hypothetical protein